MKHQKKMIITGGCGYVGAAFVHALLASDSVERVIVYDNLSKGRLESIGSLLRDHGTRLRFVHGDLRDKAKMTSVLAAEKPTAMVHLGAIVDAPSSVTHDRRILCEEVNHKATLELGILAQRGGIEHFIYQSSTSVYGDGNAGEVFTEETSPLRPLTPYGETKLKGEAILELDGPQMAVTVLRPATVFGFSPAYRYEMAINLFTVYAHYGIPLTIYQGAEGQVRPYLAIEDSLQALMLCLERSQDTHGRVWNVVSFNAPLSLIIGELISVFGQAKVVPTEVYDVNQISFEVSGKRFESIGFRPNHDLRASFVRVRDYLRSIDRVLAVN